jgi:hypothetical protein
VRVRVSARRPPRVRPRLSRTLSAARWGEYEVLLRRARARGYRLRSLEDWLDDPGAGEPTVILRHDVDQDPRSVLRMAAIEEQEGIRSTWYFRWRTAHPVVIARLRASGFAVGLHYETLSRQLLAAGRREATEEDVERCRAQLREEIRAFVECHGPIRSICPHGDTRLPGVTNAILVRGTDPQELGVRWDGNEAMRRHRLGYWLTDRSAPEGAWKDGQDPQALLAAGVTPILCLTHPNNWSSGLSLWTDRALCTAFPERRYAWQHRPRLVHAGTDTPPPLRA